MESQSLIYQWLLEYAFKHRMKYAVFLLRQRLKDIQAGFTYRPIWAALYSLQCMVEEGDVHMFDHAIQLTSIIVNHSADLISVKYFAKIVNGLKIMSLFDMLKKGDDLVIPKLNEYFPRDGFKHEKADEKLLKKLTGAQRSFRKFFLPLIANKEERENYIKNELEKDFGSVFLHKVKDMVIDFVEIVANTLPETMIEKLLEMNQSSVNWQSLSNCNDAHVQLLLDMIQDQDKLSEQDVVEFVTDSSTAKKLATGEKRAQLLNALSGDKDEISQPPARPDSSSSVESITPKQFYRKSSGDSSTTSRSNTDSSLRRKRKSTEKDDVSVARNIKQKRIQKSLEPVSPDLISDNEGEKEDNKTGKAEGIVNSTPQSRNTRKVKKTSENAAKRRESDEMVAPSPHSSSFISNRMRKTGQHGGKNELSTPRTTGTNIGIAEERSIATTPKKKLTDKHEIEPESGDDMEATESRRSQRTTPSVYKRSPRTVKEGNSVKDPAKEKEIEESGSSTDSAPVRRSPRSRSGSTDTGKSGSSEDSVPLLKQIHTKKLKESQSSKNKEVSEKNISTSDQNAKESVRQNSPKKTNSESGGRSKTPTKDKQRATKDNEMKSRKEKLLEKQSTTAEEELEMEVIITPRIHANKTNKFCSEGSAVEEKADDDVQIVAEIDADADSNSSDEEFLDASEVHEDADDEFVDASEEFSAEETNEKQAKVINVSDQSQPSSSQEAAVKTAVQRQSQRSGTDDKSGTNGRVERDEDSGSGVDNTQEIRRIMGDLNEVPQKTPSQSSEESFQSYLDQSPKLVSRSRKRNIVDSSDDTAGESPATRRSRRTHKESPLVKEMKSADGVYTSPLKKPKSTVGDNTPKDSPQFARFRNRNRILSTDETSSSEETPEVRRSKRIESPLVKEVTPKQTKVKKVHTKQNAPRKKASDQLEINSDGETNDCKDEEVQNVSYGSDESIGQFGTPSRKVDREVTLNYYSQSPVRIDKDITLNIGKDSPKVQTPKSGTRSSVRLTKRNTPDHRLKASPLLKGVESGKSISSEKSPTKASPLRSRSGEIPKSPPKANFSELVQLMQHTPKGQYGRWQKTGPVLYKMPSPPHVTRVVNVEDTPKSAKKEKPCAKDESVNHPDPTERFAPSPRILRASKASPSPVRSAKKLNVGTPGPESPVTTPRSTRRTRQASGLLYTESPRRRTPRATTSGVAEKKTHSASNVSHEISQEWSIYRNPDVTGVTDSSEDDEEVPPSASSECEESLLVPSSYSFLQYDGVHGTGSQPIQICIPQIDQHLNPSIRPCIVKIYRRSYEAEDPKTGKRRRIFCLWVQTSHVEGLCLDLRRTDTCTFCNNKKETS